MPQRGVGRSSTLSAHSPFEMEKEEAEEEGFPTDSRFVPHSTRHLPRTSFVLVPQARLARFVAWISRDTVILRLNPPCPL